MPTGERMRIRAIMLSATVFTVLSAAAYGSISDKNADVVFGQKDYTSQQINGVNAKGFQNPRAVALDAVSGRVYVADTTNNRVLWWNNAAALVNGAPADGVLGQSDMSGNKANRGTFNITANTLCWPKALTVDSAGNLWVADSNNSRVLKYNKPETNGEAAVLVLGQNTLNSNHSYDYELNHSLGWVEGIFADSSGNIWVADTARSRVLRFHNPTVNGPAPDLVLGQPDFESTGANRQTGSAGADTLNNPLAVAVDGAGIIWVADTENNRALKFDLSISTANAVAVIGQANFTSNSPNRGAGWSASAANTLNKPRGIAVNGSNILCISDSSMYRVLVYDLAGSPTDAAIALGQPDFGWHYSGNTSADNLNTPYQIAFDASGNIWVADMEFNRVLRYSAGTLATGMNAGLVLGKPNFTASYANSVTADGLYEAYGIAADTTTGRIYAADYKNSRVIWWNNAASLASGAPADGVIGQPDLESGSPNRGGTPAANTLKNPKGVFVDGAGNLWVADSENHRVLRFPAPVVSGASADLALGQMNFTTGGTGLGSNQLSYPYDVALDAQRNVWVVDSANCRILKFNYPQSNGFDPAELVLGQADFTHGSANRGGSTSAGGLCYPRSLAFDAAGRLWVADEQNHRVIRFNAPSVNGADADFVVGQANLTSGGVNRGGNPAANTLSYPFDITFDLAGALWVCDRGNCRILGYMLEKDPSCALFLLGKYNYTYGGSYGPTRNEFGFPMGICADALGNIWSADSYVHRVLKFKSLAMLSHSPSSGYNYRSQTVFVNGQEFTAATNIKLCKTGEQDITTVRSLLSSAELSFAASLIGKATGMWDIVITTGEVNSSYSIRYLSAYEILSSTSAVFGAVGGSAASTLSLSLDWGTVTVEIPAGTFASSIFMSISPATISLGASQIIEPTGIAIDIQNSIDAQPLRDITIRLSYSGAGIAQGSEARLAIARYDEQRRSWIILPSTVDAANDTVTGLTGHLSKFALVLLTPKTNLDSVVVYPNPYKPNSGQAYGDSLLGKGIVFSGLTERANIKIYTVAGELVRELDTTGVLALWDAKNGSGASVASGVYIYLISDPDNSSHKAKGKLAIIK